MREDAELLAAWRGGDHGAGEALVSTHYDAVLRFFRTKAGDDADDLVQRTFLRCAEPKLDFRGQSSFKSFLFGVARNVLLEHIRMRVRDGRPDPDFGVSSIMDLTPGVSTLAFAKTEQRMLVQALQRLPVELQLTLELHYWEELSVDEVAEALAVPPGTVKSRLHRGRSMLGEILERGDLLTGAGDAAFELERWASEMRARRPREERSA